MKKKIRVLIVDDHFSARLGIGLAIREEPDMTVIAEATNGTQAVSQYDKHLPDVVIMDYNLPDFNGVEAAKKIHVTHPDARILMFTIHEGEEDIHRATCAEVFGYITKSAELEEVLSAIRTVGAGGRWFPRSISAKLESRASRDHLSDREIDILRHIVKGSANKEIADSLHLSGGTVKRHVSLILEKLGAPDRTRAAILAIERGLIRLGE